VSATLSVELYRRAEIYRRVWDLSWDEFVDEVTDHGKFSFTAKRIEAVISGR
jgi:hypothetical protein